jgi:hypothetical protein
MIMHTETESSRSHLLPKGRYRARALEYAFGMTTTGREQIAVVFEILDEQFAGQRITWYGFFGDDPGRGTKTPTEITVEALRNCGWSGNDLADLSGIDANEVILVVEQERFKGELHARVKFVNRPSMPLKSRLSPAQVQAFAAKMRGSVAAAGRALKNAEPAGKADDDSIPF